MALSRLFNLQLPEHSKWSHACPYRVVQISNKELAILRPYAGDVLILDVITGRSSSLKFRDSDSERRFQSLIQLEELPPHGLDFKLGKLFVFDPATQSILVLDLSGHIQRRIPCPLKISGFAVTGSEEYLVLGVHGGNWAHVLSADGEIRKSTLPLEPGDGPLTTPYPEDLSCIVTESGHFYILLDRGAGIIDEYELQTLGRLGRTALRNRNTLPVVQSVGSWGASTRPYWGLQFPWHPPRAISISAAGDGLVCISGNGQHITMLTTGLNPTMTKRLPEVPGAVIRGDFPFKYSPHVFSVVRANQAWIICCWDGNLWVCEDSDLRPASEEECSVSLLPGTESGHPLTTLGSPLLVAEEEIRQFDELWRLVKDARYEFDLEIDKYGRPTSGRIATDAPRSSGRFDPAVADRILSALLSMRFSPRVVRGEFTSANPRVCVSISGWVVRLIEEKG